VRMESGQTSTEIWSVDGGALWNDAWIEAFEDLKGAENAHFFNGQSDADGSIDASFEFAGPVDDPVFFDEIA